MSVDLDVVVFGSNKREVEVEIKDAADIEEAGTMETIPLWAIESRGGMHLKAGEAGRISVNERWARDNGWLR